MKAGSPATRERACAEAGSPGREGGRGLRSAHEPSNWEVPVGPASKTTDTCYPAAALPKGATAPGRESSLRGVGGPCLPFLRKVPMTPVVGTTGKNMGTGHLDSSPQSVILTSAAALAEDGRWSLSFRAQDSGQRAGRSPWCGPAPAGSL